MAAGSICGHTAASSAALSYATAHISTPFPYRSQSVPLPQSSAQQTQQAAAAIVSAWKDGVKRQHVELLLPLIGATDLDDWPGGIRWGAESWEARGYQPIRWGTEWE